MGKVIVYCPVSGCTPEAASDFLLSKDDGEYTPAVASAIEALVDAHELASQDDLCIIGPPEDSGEDDGSPDDLHIAPELRPSLVNTICITPHCVMGDSWDIGYVDFPPPNEQDRSYNVHFGFDLMVQTYALEILALSTQGRMTPLRLWRLVMKLFSSIDHGSEGPFEGVDYGEIRDQYGDQDPEPFPGLSSTQLIELGDIGDVEVVKERLVHEGLFFMWMAPDRFPVVPTDHQYIMPPDAHPGDGNSVVEKLPAEMLGLIVSFLPLRSLLNLTATSHHLRAVILRSNHIARVWIYHNAPWWIPVPTQTPRKDDPQNLSEATAAPPTYPGSEWSGETQLSLDFPSTLDWAYVGRCMRSGSMRNRRRIWKATLDIERVADLEGV